MKIRSGFVSNSSSSSFIVSFDKLPENAAAVQKLLFADEETVKLYDYVVPTSEMAEKVWGDIQRQLEELPYSLEVLADDVHNLVYWEMYYIDVPLNVPGLPPELQGKLHTSEKIRKHWYEFNKGPERDCERELQDKELRERQENVAKKFLEENKGKVILRFSYSDNDGELSTVMEHGEIFANLPHIQISNH